MNLLESKDAPKDYRIVVVVDELDKATTYEMLDDVIMRFKNLQAKTGRSNLFGPPLAA